VNRIRLVDLYPDEFQAARVSSFSDLLDAARVYLHADPIAQSIAEAQRTVANGTATRVNPTTIATDVTRLRQIGLRALLAERSAAVRHRTYQPSAIWPVAPYTGARPDDIRNLSTLIQGAPVVRPSGFQPNQGRTARPPDPTISLPVELHFADDHAKGLCLILPWTLGLQAAYDADIDINISPLLITRKVNKPLGRLCFDFTAGGLNTEEKKETLSDTYGPIVLPQVLQFALSWERARTAFPRRLLHAYATDYDTWYKRIMNEVEAMGLYATCFIIDGERYLFLPLVEQFGSQDSGFHSNVGSRYLYAHMERRHLRLYGTVVAVQYSDDTFGFLPPSLIDGEVAALTADAHAFAGTGAIASHKNRKGCRVDGNGWSWHAPDGTFTLTYSILLRMLCVLFLEIPVAVAPGDPILKNTLERLSAYCLRACVALPSMRSFSRGASHNLARFARSPHPTLLPQTIVDIFAWRAAFQIAFSDASWLVTPTSVPILLSPSGPLETAGDRACRQASAARFINHVDASLSYLCAGFALSHGTGHPNIDGSAVVPFAWGVDDFPFLAEFVQSMAALCPARAPINRADINILETIGGVTALLALEHFLVSASPLVQPDGRHRGLIHIHTWTDNSSALSWMTSHRSTHPLHAFLLQTLAFAMQRSRLLLTFGHVPGVLNVTADAISRHFMVPAGTTVQARLRTATRCPASANFTESLKALCSTVSTDPFVPVRAALTALA
jgi:hypothetical protein